MNVGSILNGESPPEVSEANANSGVSDDSRPPAPLHQRHSINNLLNDTPGEKARSECAKEGKSPKNKDHEENKESESTKEPESRKPSVDADMSDDSISEMVNSTEREINKVISKESNSISESRSESRKGSESREREVKDSDKKPLINSELEKINKLKGANTKPKRYDEPPIWAQRYYPPNQGPKDAVYKNMPSATTVAASQNPVFDRESMYSADLECSITGVIPPQSTVRTIAEWLYANFVEISLENRQYVELELKFGTIVGKTSGVRLDIGVSSECIYTATGDTRFEMGVHEVGWGDLKEFLNELERAYVDEAKKNPSKPRRKFNTTESDTTDFFFHVSERNEKPQKIRISKDNGLVPPRYVGIQKKRLSDIYIHSPSCVYDLRLSLSLEMPVNEANVEPLMKKKPTLQRAKKRTSYSHAPTVTRFDFTEVSLPKKTKNKFGKTVVESERSHELELEIDTYQIFRGFDKIRDGSDTIRFEELVEIFLNNARCLNNRVTKLASK